jgi:hypothetical protein
MALILRFNLDSAVPYLRVVTDRKILNSFALDDPKNFFGWCKLTGPNRLQF